VPEEPTLLQLNANGLYCEAGDFYIDPWGAVDRAIITHAHGDHARWGSRSYLGSQEGKRVLRTRLGAEAQLTTLQWGDAIDMGGVRVSLHPAGHILGSAQVRVEHRGEIWVVSGDYKTEPDATCTAFELLRCHCFITESTFGLPIYRWKAQQQLFDEIRDWWRSNRDAERASVLFAYALGKAQRVLAGLLDADIGPIYTHGAVERLTRDYRESGIALPVTVYATSMPQGHNFAGSLILAPPSAGGSTWLRRFGEYSCAFVSGWMQIRGTRRRRALDRGFALSDHADWPALLETVNATGAEQVWVTHGYREQLVRFLADKGIAALNVASKWEGELEADVAVADEEISA
jgi:putative mRNA 3-end processing factor